MHAKRAASRAVTNVQEKWQDFLDNYPASVYVGYMETFVSVSYSYQGQYLMRNRQVVTLPAPGFAQRILSERTSEVDPSDRDYLAAIVWANEVADETYLAERFGV